jgi:hypothetical protein
MTLLRFILEIMNTSRYNFFECIQRLQPSLALMGFLNSFPFIFIAIREIRKVTLSLGLLSTPNPSFSGIGKVMKFY